MNNGLSESVTGFTRCAVCKIDLKGRFAYIDDLTEEVLGARTEDLLGKSFFDYVDEVSQQLILGALNERNHYESFYDSARLTLITAKGERLATDVVVSLNFIAGNPVNFQLIMRLASDESAPPAPVTSGLDDFLSEALKARHASDWKPLLRGLRQLTGASVAAVYVVSGDQLEPRSGVTCDSSPEYEFASIPPTTGLHQQVTQSGERYSFQDNVSVRKAVEQVGEAPDEYVACIAGPDDQTYLVRLVFHDLEKKPAVVQSDLQRTDLAIQLIERLQQLADDDAEGDLGESVKFTIGFLDSLGIGALLIDKTGQLLGFNPTLAGWCGDESPDGRFDDFGRMLDSYSGSDISGLMTDYFNTPLDPEAPIDLNVMVTLPNGIRAEMVVVRLSFELSDRSACIAVVPKGDAEAATDDSVTTNDHGAASPTGPIPSEVGHVVDDRFWYSTVSALRSSLRVSLSAAQKLSHRYYNRLTGEGDRLLKRMDQGHGSMRAMLDDLAQMLRQTVKGEEPALVDLNLLLDEVQREVRRIYPDRRFDCSFENLPKLVTTPETVSTVFYHLIVTAVLSSNKKKARVRVSAEKKSAECRITVADNGPGLAAADIERAFDFQSRLPHPDHRAHGLVGPGLAVARRLLESVGGDMSLTSQKGRGNRVSLTLPVYDQ